MNIITRAVTGDDSVKAANLLRCLSNPIVP